MHLVHYTSVAPHLMRSGPAVIVVHDSLVECLVDRTQLDPRMFEIMANLGNMITSILVPRPVPSVDLWCQVHLPRVNAETPGLLIPKLTSDRLVIPLPHNLITEDLAQHLAILSAGFLRFYQPPIP